MTDIYNRFLAAFPEYAPAVNDLVKDDAMAAVLETGEVVLPLGADGEVGEVRLSWRDDDDPRRPAA